MIQRTISHCAACLALIAAAATISTSPANAAIESRDILKTYFETGDVPTQDQFYNLIDSAINYTDDGLTLYGIGVTPDSAGGRFLRVGKNVGINELLPDTKLSVWRKAPVPNIPPLPGMCPSFCGLSHGFLPLQYVGPDGTSFHYGFLQISMEDDDGVATLGGGGGASVSHPAIFVHNWVWETTPGATVTTFIPEPTTATLLITALALLASPRRR